MTGAFSVTPVAGPIEFSTGELVFILVLVFALLLVLPVAAGTVAVVLYRRRTPEAERTGRGAVLEFLKWAAIAFVAQFVIQEIFGMLA